MSKKYDAIFCTEVLEHLEKPHIALKNLIAACRPGGQLVLTVPNGRTDNLNQHINFWSPESWSAFLQRECEGHEVRTAMIFNDHGNLGLVTIAGDQPDSKTV